MKQTLKNLSIAALVVLGAMMGCTGLNDELKPVDQSKNGKVVTVTTTVNMAEGVGTKALTNRGVKTFADGEQIAVVYTNQSEALVKATSTIEGARITNEGKSVTFTVELTAPKAGDATIVYPAAMVDANGVETSLSSQDGTLATIASSYDYATGAATLTQTGDVYTLSTGVSLVNQLAIGEFTIEYPADTPLTQIKSLTINDGTNNYVATSATDFGTGPIYVAMKPITSGQTLTLTAAKGSTIYTKSVTGKALSAGQFGHITLQMTSTAINLALLTDPYEVQNGDVLTGTLQNNVKITIADGATVTLDGVNINGSGSMTSGDYAGLTCLGDATIILKENTTNIVKGFDSHYPGIQAGPSGKTLTIQGSGSLDASSNGNAPGIGVKGGETGGNIVIQGGTIVATGGTNSAAIGTGATGTCGTITITSDVISVTANKGAEAKDSIGRGGDTNNSCGTVTIGFKVLWNGSEYRNGGDDPDNGLPHTPYVYPKPRPTGAIGGLFRINDAGDQVYFSQGNLQYMANSTGAAEPPYTPVWRFGEKQYSYVGNTGTGNVYVGEVKSTNASISESYDGWIDLFGWGTKNDPYKTSGSYGDYTWEGDWGENVISNGGDASWCTLTDVEWGYIFKTRSTGKTINGVANARWAPMRIGGINGVILIPDNYTGPSSSVSGITWTSYINTKTPSQWNQSSSCTTEGWAILEAAGCVFLPAAGQRGVTNSYNSIAGYWSSVSKQADSAYGLYVGGSSAYFPDANGDYKQYGEAVRLTTSAN